MFERLLKKINILHDEMEDDVYKMRLKFAVHVAGGSTGLIISVFMAVVFKTDIYTTLIAGAAGKTGIDYIDYRDRML